MTKGRYAAEQAKWVRSRLQPARQLMQQRQQSQLERRCTDGRHFLQQGDAVAFWESVHWIMVQGAAFQQKGLVGLQQLKQG